MLKKRNFEFIIQQELHNENICRLKIKININYTPFEIEQIFYEILKDNEELQYPIYLALKRINNENL
jgi:hypothetical protein